jgi:hypothetical protein
MAEACRNAETMKQGKIRIRLGFEMRIKIIKRNREGEEEEHEIKIVLVVQPKVWMGTEVELKVHTEYLSH